MFTNCFNSGLMICPYYLFAEVGDIETDLAHTINFRKCVSPIVNLLKRSVPVVVKLWGVGFAIATAGH